MLTTFRRRHGDGTGNFAVVILAAAGSAPGSRPVQLCRHLGRTVVEHAAVTALASGARQVVVVVGDRAAEIRAVLSRYPVTVVDNPDWREGLSSSIRTGVSRIAGDIGAVVISLCDRTSVTSDHIRALANQVLGDGGATIAASDYDGIVGAPSAFHRSEFSRLLLLSGPHGARSLLRDYGAAVEIIPFDAANVKASGPILRPQSIWTVGASAIRSTAEDARDARAPPNPKRNPTATWRAPSGLCPCPLA